MQAVLKTQPRCNLINSLPSPQPEQWKRHYQHFHQKHYWLLFFLSHFILAFSFCLLSQWLEKKNDSLPFGWVMMESTGEESFSTSLLLELLPSPPLSLSISLSTIAIMQFRLFPTLAHTLSWKEHEYHYGSLLQNQDEAKSDESTWEQQEEEHSCRLSDSNPPIRLAKLCIDKKSIFS